MAIPTNCTFPKGNGIFKLSDISEQHIMKRNFTLFGRTNHSKLTFVLDDFFFLEQYKFGKKRY